MNQTEAPGIYAPVDSSSLPLILFAAVQHPDPDLKKKLRTRLSKWILHFEPQHDAGEILRALDRCKGTPIEPFSLDDDDRYLAVFLTRLAFSSKLDIAGVRIVSHETIGARGGCLLNRELKYKYLERFVPARSPEPPATAWWLAPSEIPSPDLLARSAFVDLQTVYSVTEAGISVLFEPLDYDLLRWKLTLPIDHKKLTPYEQSQLPNLKRDLERFALIGTKSAIGLGLRVLQESDKVVVSTGQAENIMRLVAHLVDRPVLRLDPGSAYPGRIVLAVRLEPAEESMALNPTPMVTGGYVGEWIGGKMPAGPALGSNEILSITQWAIAHESWADVVFPESSE